MEKLWAVIGRSARNIPLYVPDPWLQPQNRLEILDEEGKSPSQTYLMRDARVPVASQWL